MIDQKGKSDAVLLASCLCAFSRHFLVVSLTRRLQHSSNDPYTVDFYHYYYYFLATTT